MAKNTIYGGKKTKIRIKATENRDLMLVMIADEQILSVRQVCQNCLMADRSGLPRWYEGKLRCGRALDKSTEQQATVYECQMGFRVTQVS